MTIPSGRRRSDGMIMRSSLPGRPRSFSVRDLGAVFTWGGDQNNNQVAPAPTTDQKFEVAPIVAAADDAPMMIICYSRETAQISYINKEVYRVLGPDACVGKHVEDILDPAFKARRSLEDCRALFGIGEMVETKKSPMELRSAAANTLPAMLVMRANTGGTHCTATIFPGHAFQADFLEWQTAKTYRAANVPGARPPITDIGSTSDVGQTCKPIFVEMDELRKVSVEDVVEWMEVAHWKDGVEQSVMTTKDGLREFGRGHLSTVKFHDFLLLRKLIMRGTVLIDLEVPAGTESRAALNYIASAIVSDMIAAGSLPDEFRDQAMQVIQAQHVHAANRRKKRADETKGKNRRPAGDETPPSSEHGNEDGAGESGHGDGGRPRVPPILRSLSSGNRGENAEQQLRDAEDEACDVLAATVSFAQSQVAAFVRLKTAVDLGDMTEHENGFRPPPVRFIVVVFGPAEAERDNHNAGHAIACMMSNRDFARKAQVLRNKDDLLESIDGSIDHTNLTFAQNIEHLHAQKKQGQLVGEGTWCCGLFGREDDPFAIETEGIIPTPWGNKRRYQAVTVVEVPVSAVPAATNTYEVKTIEKPQSIIKLKRRDAIPGSILLVISLFCVILMTLWHPHEQRGDVLTAKMTRFNTYITSPLFATEKGHPLKLYLDQHGPRGTVDVKMVAACTAQDCGGAEDHRRRRLGSVLHHGRRMSRDDGGLNSDITLREATYVEWALIAGHTECQTRRYDLFADKQVETLIVVDLDESACASANRHGEELVLEVRTDSQDPLSVLAQTVQNGVVGRHRVLIAGILFVAVFAGIISEVIHRCYTTFIGSFIALGLVALTHEVPSIPTVVAMIDAGTLMLLFAMMVNVHLLSLTGFFQWIAVRMVEVAKGNVMVLFFLLTNLTGILSAFLDNVTCVLLIGPVTIKLCEQMNMNPVPFYLTETIAATIGGTATLIGDPPNVVIGNKLSLRFNDFIIFNGPLVVVIMPLATVIQYYRFKHSFPKENVKLDMEQLKADNKIHDERSLFFLSFIFLGIFLGLFLFELHGHEPAWFCLLGMLGASVATSRHDIRHVLHAVEWDTLLFFAALFVFVESLAELGLIRFIGAHMSDIIRSVPIDSRLTVAMVIFLWVSAIGSAFLESLPYTTTITYIIINLLNEDNLGIPILPLAWALSVGACVGGIGSIMGSSANLVSIGVSERYAPGNPIKGKHFLQYGFPLLLVSISIATLYQWVLFVQIEPYK